MEIKRQDPPARAALVTDAHIRAVVAGIRALGQAGVEITAMAARRGAPGLWSRYVSAREIASDPAHDPSGFVDAVASTAGPRGVVVYPGSEASIAAVIEGWEALTRRGAVLPYPGPGPLLALRDKRRLPDLAASAGLSGLDHQIETTAGELVESPPAPPFVLKSANPATALSGSRLIERPDQLVEVLASRPVPPEEPLLVQERMSGPLISLELVIDRDGGGAAGFQQVADATSPVVAGSISSAVSVPIDRALAEGATRMLSGVGYWGLAQIDLIDDRRRGATVIDVNPRFYSCLPLASACGVNLPAVWHAIASGLAPEPLPGSYPSGIRFRWLEGDFRAAAKGALRRLRRQPGRARVGAAWSSRDPLPGALLTLGAMTLDLRRLLGGRRFR
jgi:predicted ATP-grasp superfamily ATP-dependent carboligase